MYSKVKTASLYFTDRLTVAMRGINDYPITIVEAPMGYGKTTAVKGHLKQFGAKDFWVKIHDELINGFWNGLCYQLESIDKKVARSLFELGFPDDSVSMHEALRLIQKLKLPENSVLVLDDYHLINKETVNRFVHFLAMSEIKNLKIVLIARFVELRSMEELSLKGYLHYITKDTFELNSDDIKKYYRVCGINLKDRDAERLYAFTEGWISALYLCMLNYVAHGEFEMSKDIYKLVGNAVYLNFSAEIKEFLLCVCFFDGFTLEQAEEVSQRRNAELLLSEIIGKNALVKYDENTNTYHFHKIFSKYLKDLFHQRGGEYKKRIHQRTGNFYRKNKDYIEAMEAFYLAQDFDSLLGVVEEDKGSSIYNEQKEIFIKYFEECPDQIRWDHPVAILIYAICLFSFNEMERFQMVCGEFSQILSQSKCLKPEELNSLMGEFELLLSFTEYNHIQRMAEHIKLAGEFLKRPARFLDTKSSWTFGAPSVLYMFYRESGTLEQEVANLKEALPIYQKLTNGHGLCGEHIMEGERYFNLGDFESAEIALNRTLYSNSRKGQGDVAICAMLLQARMELAKGEYAAAFQHIHQMRDEISRKRWYAQIHTIDLCEGFLYANLNQYENIPAWIREGNVDASKIYYPTRGFFNLVYGRVLLIHGEYLKLLGVAEAFEMEASVFPNLLSLIYTKIYVAAANQKIHRHGDALEALKQALDHAAADKVYLPFVENCDYIKSLLEELERNGQHREAITAILGLESSYHTAVRQMIKENTTEKKPVLTEREQEIANLAAQGHTNKEIGDQLFITENTVKMALKSIYSKLSINNRVLLKQYFD